MSAVECDEQSCCELDGALATEPSRPMRMARWRPPMGGTPLDWRAVGQVSVVAAAEAEALRMLQQRNVGPNDSLEIQVMHRSDDTLVIHSLNVQLWGGEAVSARLLSRNDH